MSLSSLRVFLTKRGLSAAETLQRLLTWPFTNLPSWIVGDYEDSILWVYGPKQYVILDAALLVAKFSIYAFIAIVIAVAGCSIHLALPDYGIVPLCVVPPLILLCMVLLSLSCFVLSELRCLEIVARDGKVRCELKEAKLKWRAAVTRYCDEKGCTPKQLMKHLSRKERAHLRSLWNNYLFLLRTNGDDLDMVVQEVTRREAMVGFMTGLWPAWMRVVARHYFMWKLGEIKRNLQLTRFYISLRLFVIKYKILRVLGPILSKIRTALACAMWPVAKAAAVLSGACSYLRACSGSESKSGSGSESKSGESESDPSQTSPTSKSRKRRKRGGRKGKGRRRRGGGRRRKPKRRTASPEATASAKRLSSDYPSTVPAVHEDRSTDTDGKCPHESGSPPECATESGWSECPSFSCSSDSLPDVIYVSSTGVSYSDVSSADEAEFPAPSNSPAPSFRTVTVKTDEGDRIVPLYPEGAVVYYRDSSGVIQRAQVVASHQDDSLEPYYSIRLVDGREKQTDNAHIRLSAKDFDEPTDAHVHETSGGCTETGSLPPILWALVVGCFAWDPSSFVLKFLATNILLELCQTRAGPIKGRQHANWRKTAMALSFLFVGAEAEGGGGSAGMRAADAFTTVVAAGAAAVAKSRSRLKKRPKPRTVRVSESPARGKCSNVVESPTSHLRPETKEFNIVLNSR